MSATPSPRPQVPPPGAPPPAPPPRSRRGAGTTIAIVVGGLLIVVGVVALAGQLLRSTDRSTLAVDGEVHQLVVEMTAGDLEVVVADDGSQVTNTERRLPWSRTNASVALEDGVLRVTSSCRSWLFDCSVDHRVELPAGVDVQFRGTAGEVRLDGIGDADVELTAGDIVIDGATGDSIVTRSTAGETRIRATHPPQLLDASATAGELVITVPDETYRVEATTVAGDVSVDVDEDDGSPRTIRARTTAGSVLIRAER